MFFCQEKKSSCSGEHTSSLPQEFNESYSDKQGEAQKIFQQMQQLYGSVENFPDFYAGDYLDPASGNFVILTCNAQDSELENLKLLLQTDQIDFRPAKYSLKELRASCDWLMEQFDQLEEKDKEGYPIQPLAVANIDIMANKIRVEIYDAQLTQVPPQLQKLLGQLEPEMIDIVFRSLPKEL